MMRRSAVLAAFVLLLFAAQGCRYPYYRYPDQRYRHTASQYRYYSYSPASTQTQVTYLCAHGYADALACPYCSRSYYYYRAPVRSTYVSPYDRRYRYSRTYPNRTYVDDRRRMPPPPPRENHPRYQSKPGTGSRNVITIPAPPIILPPGVPRPEKKK